jgi:hypothetical protein
MKQTALDFIVTKFNHLNWLRRRGEISEVTEYERQAKFFFEAKKMEKEQIKDAFISGEHQQGFEDEAEQYYNETFNTK